MSAASAPNAIDPARIFAALGDPTRLSLLLRLSDGERRSITGLTGDGRLTRQAIAKHLRVLQEAGLVERRRHGRATLYGCCPAPLDVARDYLDRVGAQWDEGLGRLKIFVETDP